MFRAWHNQQRLRLRSALNDGSSSAWENLGLWQAPDQAYPQAAAALAQLVGEQADLTAGDRVLDLGPGLGDDQERLWRREFGIEAYYGWERDRPAPPDLSWDHVLAVDSAYFIPGLWHRWQQLWPRINPGGSITWTDLYWRASPRGFAPQLRWRLTSAMAGIPWPHWATDEQWQARLASLPDGQHQFMDLTDRVLGGFVRFIDEREQQQLPRDGLWLAYGTAKLLRPLLADGAIGYGLFQAKRVP